MAARRSEAAHKGMYFFLDAWMGDTGVQQCSFAAQGLWFNMLCRAWFETPRGVLPGDPLELARVMGCPGGIVRAYAAEVSPLLDELEGNGVFSRGRHVNEALPENAIVNRRMFRGWMAETGRQEQAKKAASVRWGKSNGSMLNDAQGYAHSECSSDAQGFGTNGATKTTCNESRMLRACSPKMLSGCLSPTLTLNSGTRSTPVSRSVGGVGEDSQARILADRLASLEATPGIDADTKRRMRSDLIKRYGKPASAPTDGTVGLTAQRLTVDAALSLDEDNPTEPGRETAFRPPHGNSGRDWKPASRRKRGELVERCVRVTGDGQSRRNWWNLIDALCPTQAGESRLLSVLLEFEDRMRRKDPSDTLPAKPGAVLNSRLRKAIDELNLQPRRKGK